MGNKDGESGNEVAAKIFWALMVTLVLASFGYTTYRADRAKQMRTEIALTKADREGLVILKADMCARLDKIETKLDRLFMLRAEDVRGTGKPSGQ